MVILKFFIISNYRLRGKKGFGLIRWIVMIYSSVYEYPTCIFRCAVTLRRQQEPSAMAHGCQSQLQINGAPEYGVGTSKSWAVLVEVEKYHRIMNIHADESRARTGDGRAGGCKVAPWRIALAAIFSPTYPPSTLHRLTPFVRGPEWLAFGIAEPLAK